MSRITRFFTLPATDTFFGLERSIQSGALGLLAVGAGLVVGWWVYVPIHELLHALACLAAGGSVTELEIAPLYGGALFAALIPWVTAGGEYAGRLSGFDTGGSDLVYLATDLGPYLLTLLPGVWLLRRAAASGHGFLFGLSLPVALAPFVSLIGDAYEIGSILTTQVPPWAGAEALLRGDDVFLKAEELAASGAGAALWSGFATAFLLGALWAFSTYALGGWIARRLGRAPVEALPRPPRRHP